MRCNPLRWLWGLVPLAMLGLVAYLWAPRMIEDDLSSRSRQALIDSRIDWAGVTFVGRDGTVNGRAADEREQRLAAIVVAKVAGVRNVIDSTSISELVKTYVWSATLAGRSVQLAGYVPNQAARAAINRAAKEALPPEYSIDDRMKVARGVPDQKSWLAGTQFALQQLARLKSGGRVEMDGLSLSAAGESNTSAGFELIREALNRGLPNGLNLKENSVVAPLVKPYAWAMRQQDARIVLTGHVPSQRQRGEIVAAAKRAFPGADVDDRMGLGRGEPRGWQSLVMAALDQARQLKQPRAELIDTRLSISGFADSDEALQRVRKTLRSVAPTGFRVADTIELDPDVKTRRAAEEAARRAAAERTRREADERRSREAAAAAQRQQDEQERARRAAADAARGDVADQARREAAERRAREAAIAAQRLRQQQDEARQAAEEQTRTAAAEQARREAAERRAREAAISAQRLRQQQDEARRAAEEQTRRAAAEQARREVEERRIREAIAAQRLRERQELARREAEQQARRAAAADEARREASLRARQQQLSAAQSQAQLAEAARQQALLRQAEAERRRIAEVRRQSGAIPTREPAGATSQRVAVDRCQADLTAFMRSNTINFDRARATLDRESRVVLDRISTIVKACPDIVIEVGGHTDAEGIASRKQRLSDRRASAVVDYLVRAGVSGKRLTSVGYADTKAVADNATASGRARNRRIEFIVRSPN